MAGGMAAPFLLSPCLAGKSRTKPLNVLLLCVDDLRPEMGCLGTAYAQTENMDRLSRRSVRFTHHFVQVATCGASRYALLTGRSPARSGVTRGNGAMYQGQTAFSQAPTPKAQTLPECFRRSGYHTVCIGKISHTPDGRVYSYDGTGDGRPEMPHAWDELATPFGPWKRGWGAFFAYEKGRHREDGMGHTDLMEFTAEQDEELPDGLLAQAAVDKLKELATSDQPFFLAVGFYKPHLPFVGTRKDWEAMQDADIPIASHQARPDSVHWHRSGEFNKYNAPFQKDPPLREEDQLKAKRAYLACVRFTDRQIGKVLDALDVMGLADNTVIVLWGDHGWHLGDSQIWGKHTPFERAVHSPLMIHVPGMENQGQICNALVETIDLFPTLLEVCSPSFQDTEFPLDGHSLCPLIKDVNAKVRDAALSYWGSAVTVRTATHRLIASRSEQGFENLELYDMGKGPDPAQNLAETQPDKAQELLGYMPSWTP